MIIASGVYVDPTMRQKCVGRLLVSRVLQKAFELDRVPVLDVLHQSALATIPLYASLGFKGVPSIMSLTARAFIYQ